MKWKIYMNEQATIHGITHSVEDYLKTIYQITTIYDRASTKKIAQMLKVSPASVTGMMKKLDEINPPLIEYQKHHGVVLTPEGNRIALEIIRNHRLLEVFLHQVLDYDWDEVHEEADQLEHVISEEFEQRIEKALGYPSYDPHGDPIPNKDLEMPVKLLTCLSDLRPGQSGIVMQVRDEDPELLRYLQGLGIIPGVRIDIIDYSKLDDNLTVKVPGRKANIILGQRITQEIFIELNS
jgi:DtxR family Mn-dependent transcriptional regulator